MSDNDLAPSDDSNTERPEDSSEQQRIEYQGWFGPVPDPDTLRRFEESVPGVGDRLISTFEIQVHSRLAHEHYESVTRRHGLYLIFILSLVLIGAGVYATSVGLGWGMVPVSAIALGSLFTSAGQMLRKSGRNGPDGR